MSKNGPSVKELAQMINSFMGTKVLTEKQLDQIMQGAQKAHERGGMTAVLEYLMKVTQADVDFNELEKFAKNVQANPNLGMDILQGKKKFPKK